MNSFFIHDRIWTDFEDKKEFRGIPRTGFEDFNETPNAWKWTYFLLNRRVWKDFKDKNEFKGIPGTGFEHFNATPNELKWTDLSIKKGIWEILKTKTSSGESPELVMNTLMKPQMRKNEQIY